MTNQTAFAVSFDADEDGFIVHEASSAHSFAMVPAEFNYYFGNDEAKAHEQVRRLNKWQAKGNAVRTVMIETPSRFEKVADTKYGCAW